MPRPHIRAKRWKSFHRAVITSELCTHHYGVPFIRVIKLIEVIEASVNLMAEPFDVWASDWRYGCFDALRLA